ncbi:NSA1 [Candida oxycetoniae]|uniref:Ribosome biogenesis protein NSA1 n=1 Tax=Candida oxycetoniae TaxID=497107 RepID=A0AAI9SV90_9ASCO|nr:NSA1 [Candida oxycetoniae]KAI3403718.1 NSA1 [Candida oxycetoniae]
MKVLVSSDDTGGAKLAIFKRGTDTSKQDAIQPEAITNCLIQPYSNYGSRIIHLLNYNYQYLIASRYGGILSIFDFEEKEEKENDKANKDDANEETLFEHLHDYRIPVEKDDKPVALVKAEKLDSVFVAYESGKVFVIYIGDFKFEPLLINLSNSGPISAFTNNPRRENVFAYGGKENDLQIVELYDAKVNSTIFKKEDYRLVFSPKTIFKAKNVKNDHLNLRVPIWITNVLFFSDKKEGSCKHYNLITSTRYGQLRIYDTAHGRRPIKDFQVAEKPIVTLTFASEEENEVIVTDTHNMIAKYSLTQIDDKAFKTNSASAGNIIKPVPKLLGKFTGGNTGATFGVQIHEELATFAGLDRYLRVFDLDTRQVLAKVYLGVEASSLLIIDDEDEEDEDQKRKREEEEAEDEQMWDQLNKKQKQK